MSHEAFTTVDHEVRGIVEPFLSDEAVYHIFKEKTTIGVSQKLEPVYDCIRR